MSIGRETVRRQCEGSQKAAATNDRESVVYIPYQFLIAIENDRLRAAARHHLRAAACREAAARRPRAGRLAPRGRGGLGGRNSLAGLARRRVARAFSPRAAI